MKLTEFKQSHFKQLVEWIKTDELNYLWGGPAYTFPLTQTQIKRHCAQAEVHPYLVTMNNDNVGFIELYKVTEDHYRICRVFISEEFRGQGLAKKMMTLVIDKARNDLSAEILSLAVFEHNTAARKCYESLGFKTLTVESGTRYFNGKSWKLLRMEKQF
ncbi:GNAT family N-acetyltransferase [Vibrio natriegens]|uniref:GNAT family N-acetyltransferase n=1 Tax=Vibrio natriegens TaxID=691 RepID=UPI001EFCA1A3|nr:GNAT family N-acetyltransferase [Vibrio natriegens]MCG9702124.1 GNAT family N-acetyltransferase [Vibrio natriegens]